MCVRIWFNMKTCLYREKAENFSNKWVEQGLPYDDCIFALFYRFVCFILCYFCCCCCYFFFICVFKIFTRSLRLNAHIYFEFSWMFLFTQNKTIYERGKKGKINKTKRRHRTQAEMCWRIVFFFFSFFG